MQFYVKLVRGQGHQVSDPIELQDFTDIDQHIATWALQSLHAHELDCSFQLFMVPVLARSHWFPLCLRVTEEGATLWLPLEVANAVQQVVVESCGLMSSVLLLSLSLRSLPQIVDFRQSIGSLLPL